MADRLSERAMQSGWVRFFNTISINCLPLYNNCLKETSTLKANGRPIRGFQMMSLKFKVQNN